MVHLICVGKGTLSDEHWEQAHPAIVLLGKDLKRTCIRTRGDVGEATLLRVVPGSWTHLAARRWGQQVGDVEGVLTEHQQRA